MTSVAIVAKQSGVFEATRSGFGFEKQGEGETNDWLTPPDLVKALGEFDLDPCGCPGQPWLLAKKTYFLPANDGLKDPWVGRVFCNPPYGSHVGDWAERLRKHGNGIFLIFSRTETKAWEGIWQGCDAVLMPSGRIKFFRPDGSPAKTGTAPSALIAYGQNNVEALKTCGLAGALCVKPVYLKGKKASAFGVNYAEITPAREIEDLREAAGF
jgi:hypothetical protein